MNDLNRKEDRYWTIKEIRPHIINYSKKRFPGSIIDREFSRVYLMVLGPNMTVEIQKLYSGGCTSMSGFEDEIRRQTEQNTSINMDWLYQ